VKSISESSGTELEVRVEKTTERGSSVSDIGVIVRRTSDGLVVCAVYEDDDQCEMDGSRWKACAAQSMPIQEMVTFAFQRGVGR